MKNCRGDVGKRKEKKGSLDDPIRDCTSFSLGVILLLPSTHTHTHGILFACVCVSGKMATLPSPIPGVSPFLEGAFVTRSDPG